MSTPTEEIIAALRLINTPKVGAVTFYRLVQEYGSAQNAVEALEKQSKNKPWSIEKALKELSDTRSLGADILLYDNENYPQALRSVDWAPPVLYVKGNLQALNSTKTLAIVGSRAASINGRKTAARIARDLTENGVCVVSGMARGIDTSAHKGALFANNDTGTTIAVLGTGIDVIYPSENVDVYNQIVTNGCVISDVPLGTKASTMQFPRRNRIVAALSEGVLVVEAGLKSGSLITAQYASEMQKILFAVPGTPGESRAQGANYLIKEGAVLVETAEDILPFLKGNKNIPIRQITTAQQKSLVFENNDVNFSEREVEKGSLIDFLTIDGVYVDELIRLTGKSAAIIAMEILELEMNGIVERRAGNKIALIDQN